MKKIVILGTGGTIAGRSQQQQSNLNYVAGSVAVQELIAELTPPPDCVLLAEQVAQIDSKDMEESVWYALAQRCQVHLHDAEVAGIVVTHGTDTLEESAFFLHSVLVADKPIVFTCAMRPATSASPDGPQNLRDALTVASTSGARGVVVVCAGELHDAVSVRKTHPYRLQAFTSGEAGCLGFVEEGRVRLNRPWPANAVLLPLAELKLPLPRVEIVLSHAGATGRMIELLLADQEQALQGLVIAGTGNGSLHHRVERAATDALAQGIRVWVTTRCSEGQVLPTEKSPIPSTPLPAVKARIAMMLCQ